MRFPIDGVRVGHWTDDSARTGCTVVLLPDGTVASGEVRGGAPATREFDLLAYLAARAGACCSRDEILADVWGIDFETGTNTVDVFVYALRRKLRAAGLPGLIQTVRGAGYRLDP